MKATIKQTKLPPAPKPTKAVHIDEEPKTVVKTFDELEPKKKRTKAPTAAWSDSREDELIRLYRKGVRYKVISAEMGIPFRSVRYRIHKLISEGRVERKTNGG